MWLSLASGESLRLDVRDRFDVVGCNSPGEPVVAVPLPVVLLPPPSSSSCLMILVSPAPVTVSSVVAVVDTTPEADAIVVEVFDGFSFLPLGVTFSLLPSVSLLLSSSSSEPLATVNSLLLDCSRNISSLSILAICWSIRHEEEEELLDVLDAASSLLLLLSMLLLLVTLLRMISP